MQQQMQPELNKENLFLALKTLTGSNNITVSTVNSIKESENALLQWENSNPSVYIDALIQVIHESIIGTSSTNKVTDDEQKNKSSLQSSQLEPYYSIALISILSIKAAVKRHWKPILSKRTRLIPLTDDIKQKLRYFLLALVCPTYHQNNNLHHDNAQYIFDYTPFPLWKHHTFQSNTSALLAKIGRYDLPLQFSELFPTLFTISCTMPSNTSTITTSNLLQGVFASQALDDLLYELSTKRLLLDKQLLISAAQQYMFYFTITNNDDQKNYNDEHTHSNPVYSKLLSHICSNVCQSPETIHNIDHDSFTYAHNLILVLHQLLLASFDKLETHLLESTMTFLIQITSHLFTNVISMIQSTTIHDLSVLNKLYPLLETLLDIPIQIQTKHPIFFAICKHTFLTSNENSNISNTTSNNNNYILATYLQLFYSLFQSIRDYHNNDTNPNNKNTLYSRFPGFLILTSLQFISNVSSCYEYMRVTDDFEDNDNDHQYSSIVSYCHDLIWNQFFTTQRLTEFMELILNQFMPLSSSISDDAHGLLGIWNDDPESYILMELGEGIAMNDNDSISNLHRDIRAAAQNLFLAFMESKGGIAKQTVAQYMVTLLGDFQSQIDTCAKETDSIIQASHESTNLVKDKSVLIWDAIYIAAGIAVNCLNTYVDWNVWWNKSLSISLGVLLQSEGKNPYLPILRCRIIWLIGCHAHLISPDMYIKTIEILDRSVLSNSQQKNDAAVIYATIQTLTSLLYQPPLNDDYLPFLIPPTLGTSTITSLYKLIYDNVFVEMESQRSTLSLISMMISQINTVGQTNNDQCDDSKEAILNLLRAAITPLHSIWETCSTNQQFPLQKDLFAILSCTISTIARLIPDPHSWVRELYSMVIPMVDSALNPSFRDQNLHIEEDALLVWLNLMRMSNVYDENLNHLFGRVGDVIKNDLEHLRVLSLLTEYYILLGDTNFLDSNISHITTFLSNTICLVRPRGAQYTYLVLETLLRKYPLQGGKLLNSAGICKMMLESCFWNFVQNDEKREVDSVIILYLTAFTRMLLADAHCLDMSFPLRDKNGKRLEFEPQNMIDLMFRLFESASYGESGRLRKKIWAILLLSFLPPSQSIFTQYVLTQLDQLVNVCCDVLSDSKKTLAPFAIPYDCEDEVFELEKTYYNQFVHSEFLKDIACMTDFTAYLRSTFTHFAECMGKAKYLEVVSTVEPVTFEQLRRAAQF